MAEYNEILTGRYNRFLQKLLGMKGGPPAAQLAGEIMPVLALFAGRELRYLEQWDIFAGVFTATGGAGQTAAVRIRMPAGSNTLAVLESLLLTAGSATGDSPNISYQASGAGDLAGPASAVSLDPRSARASTAVVSTSTNQAADLANVIIGPTYAAAASEQFIGHSDQELPLLPGAAYQFRSKTNAALIGASLMWRERFLEESERA